MKKLISLFVLLFVFINRFSQAVFVNNSKEPSLTVTKLNHRESGSVGLWVGEGSGGDFANLKILK